MAKVPEISGFSGHSSGQQLGFFPTAAGDLPGQGCFQLPAGYAALMERADHLSGHIPGKSALLVQVSLPIGRRTGSI